MSLPEIASFWHGSDLSLIEQVVIQSYLDQGHHFTLYTLGDIAGVPPGAEQRDSREIWSDDTVDLSGGDRHMLATYSDLFRLHLLNQRDVIWSDLDAYCVRPFEFDDEHLFGMGGMGRICTGILRLPRGGDVIRDMLEFSQSACPIQPWRRPRFIRKQESAREAGESWRIYDLPWGCAGPKLLDWTLKQQGLEGCAKPQHVFYPLFTASLRKLWMPNVPLDDIEPPGCHSVHIFGASKRTLVERHNGVPPRDSYLERIAVRHGLLKPKPMLSLAGSRR